MSVCVYVWTVECMWVLRVIWWLWKERRRCVEGGMWVKGGMCVKGGMVFCVCVYVSRVWLLQEETELEGERKLFAKRDRVLFSQCTER